MSIRCPPIATGSQGLSHLATHSTPPHLGQTPSGRAPDTLATYRVHPCSYTPSEYYPFPVRPAHVIGNIHKCVPCVALSDSPIDPSCVQMATTLLQCSSRERYSLGETLALFMLKLGTLYLIGNP